MCEIVGSPMNRAHSGVVPSSKIEQHELAMFGRNKKTKKIEDLEDIVLTHSTSISNLEIKVADIGRDMGNLRLKHKDLTDRVDEDWVAMTARVNRVIDEQKVQEDVILTIKPRIRAEIKSAEQKARVMIEKLQAEQAKIRDQLKVALQADLHQGQSIRELREEVRALRGGRAGKHEMPEHRIVPYRRDHEMVLYKPPPADGDDWE